MVEKRTKTKMQVLITVDVTEPSFETALSETNLNSLHYNPIIY